VPSVEGKARVPLAAWIVGGAGVAAMGVGVVAWAFGLNDRSALLQRCSGAGSCTQADMDHEKHKVRTEVLVGDLAFGAGLVAVGAAVWMAVSAKPKTHQVGVAPMAHGAALSYGAQF
jgi:hypothetical protein